MRVKPKLVIIVVFVGFFTINTGKLFAQKLTPEFIKSWVVHLDSSNIELVKNAVYLMDGQPFRSDDAFLTFSNYDFNEHRIELFYLSPEKASRLNHLNGPVFLMSTSTKPQKRKMVKRSLEKAIELFRDPQVKKSHGTIYKKEPAVLLEGESLLPMTAMALLKRFSPNDIETIIIAETGPTNLFGQNAKNGLVRIWLKK